VKLKSNHVEIKREKIMMQCSWTSPKDDVAPEIRDTRMERMTQRNTLKTVAQYWVRGEG
jgi:hypothetical protein